MNTGQHAAAQEEVRKCETHLGGAPLVRLGVVSGVGAWPPQRAVAGVGEAAAYRAVTGGGLWRGEQACTLQPCCHHTASAHVLTVHPPPRLHINITYMHVHTQCTRYLSTEGPKLQINKKEVQLEPRGGGSVS